MNALMTMRKIDIAAIQAARETVAGHPPKDGEQLR
jgi:hypothetical protein